MDRYLNLLLGLDAASLEHKGLEDLPSEYANLGMPDTPSKQLAARSQ
jgi:hypothetical protein